jgi:RNA polymerase sigma-70 factor, ECF subfamily
VSEPVREREDGALVQEARSGDPEALARLVQQNHAVVYRFLLARTADEDLAQDLTQDTFVKALRSLEQFRGDASFKTWLLAIARNEVLGRHRKDARRNERDLSEGLQVVDEGPLPGAVLSESMEVERIRSVMDRLPEKQRLSVWLRLYDGLSFKEVAEATDSTEGAARVNYFHGVRKLREWLNDDA